MMKHQILNYLKELCNHQNGDLLALCRALYSTLWT